MTVERLCQCGTCQEAYDNAKFAAATMPNNDCPVWMFMVTSFMYQTAFDNLMQSVAPVQGKGLAKAEKSILQLGEKLAGMYEKFSQPGTPNTVNGPTDQDYDTVAKALGLDPVDFRADYKLIRLTNGMFMGIARSDVQ